MYRLNVYSSIGQLINVQIIWFDDCISYAMDMFESIYGSDITFKVEYINPTR